MGLASESKKIEFLSRDRYFENSYRIVFKLDRFAYKRSMRNAVSIHACMDGHRLTKPVAEDGHGVVLHLKLHLQADLELFVISSVGRIFEIFIFNGSPWHDPFGQVI